MTTRSASGLRFVEIMFGCCCALVAACSEDAPARGAPAGAKSARDGVPGPQAAEGDSISSWRPPSRVSPARDDAGSSPPSPDLYDPDTIPKFELELDAAAIAVLSNPAISEKKTWVHGQFKFGGITFADVGVRRKGSNTFRAMPQKSALKVKFNKWVKGQKLHGLEEITLNNMVSDPVCITERLTYHVFREAGLPAPKANTAELTVNGENYGIYANIETPDENFLARAFGAKVKSLYEVRSIGASWLPTATGGFEIDIPFPGAPAGAKPDLDLLLQAVATASDATLLKDLDARLHTKQWLRFSAVEGLTAQPDGYAYGVIGYSHNYFVAGDNDGKFSLVPWSVDLALNDREGVDVSVPPGNTVFARCKNSTTCWDAYKAEMRSVLAVYETLDLVALAKKWHDQIDALVRSDPKREISLSTYEHESDKLFPWLAARSGVVRAQLGL